MKKLAILFIAALSLAACNNGSEGSKDLVDSIEKRTDTLQEKVDSTADARIDSIKTRAADLKDKFDSTAEARTDSIKGK